VWFGLENREYDHRDPSRWPRDTLYPQELVLTSPKSGGRSVGIVRSRTKATELLLLLLLVWYSENKIISLSKINLLDFVMEMHYIFLFVPDYNLPNTCS
jgi:hypothetical protein